MSDGDQPYIKKMIEIFIRQSESAIPQIKEFYRNGDLEKLYQLAHRIKPSIDGMGIHSLHGTIRLVEQAAKDKQNSAQLHLEVNALCDTLQLVIDQLRLL